MDLFIQQLGNGVALGSLYAIFGLGFGLVFSTLGILNAAHGTYATWGALVGLFAVTNLGLPFWAAVLVGIVGAGIIGIVVDQLAFQPLRSRTDDLLPALITSIAFWIALGAIARIATGARISRFPPGSVPERLYEAGPVLLTWIQVVSIVAAILITGAMYLLFVRTRIGAAMRAVGYDPDAASLGGANPRVVIYLTAFLAAAIAGLAGVLAGVSTSNVSFLLGESLLLKGFAAVVVGGFGDVRGTALGGILIGIFEVLGAQYVSGSFRDAITFGLLLLFLMYRPRGLFGSQTAFGRA